MGIETKQSVESEEKEMKGWGGVEISNAGQTRGMKSIRTSTVMAL